MPNVSDSPASHWAVAFVGTALAYALAGWAALWLAIPPGYASPLYPATGVALACTLTFGWRVLPGIALAAFALNVAMGVQRGTVGWDNLVMSACIGFGSTLQAAVGSALVRRFLPKPLTLSAPRDVAVFCALSGLAAFVTSSSVAVTALYFFHAEPLNKLWITWWIWGVGDALGVLIATPIVLSFIGQPRADWRSRRVTVGLTLCLATALMAFSIKKVDEWEEARVQAAFERDAIHLATHLESQLQNPLDALESLRGMFLGSEEVLRAEHQRATAAWLDNGSRIRSMGWADVVRRADLPVYQARIAADDLPGFRVFERPDAPRPGFGSNDFSTPVRFVEPPQRSRSVLGLDARSSAVPRRAIDAAILNDRPTASAGFNLLGERRERTAIIVFRAVYSDEPVAPTDRPAKARGLAFVTLQMDDLLQAFAHTQPSYLTLCLIDTDAQAEVRRLAGPAGCDTEARSGMQFEKPVRYAERDWTLRVRAIRSEVPDARAANALLFSLIGLVATTMLAALLLTVTGRALRIESAVHERTLALQREIAERERTESERRESEQRFRNILNHVPIGVVYTDVRGNIKQVNPRFCELTGYRDVELIDMNLSRIRHPEDRLNDIELTSQLARGEIPMYRRQGRYITRDGRLVQIQSTVTLLRDPNGEPYRIVGAVEDITEHLRLAEAEHARSVAEAANLAKSEFLSRMSHELRTPLNAMLGFAQLLELDQARPLPPEHRPWVAQIQSAGWHLLDMINDVLDLSRIESGTLNLQLQPLDLREVLSATLSLVERDAQRRNIIITQQVPEQTTRITGDATRVKQILTNVLSNAVKYNNDGGRIHIATRVGEQGSIDISVTDTGLGMTSAQLAQLFQPFNRLGRERSSLEGTGIGLVVSQRLAELMGGALTVTSSAGRGSSFVLSLPSAGTPPAPSDLSRAPAEAPADYHQRIVHYVEDNETNVEVMRGVLARRPQVRLDVSINGLDGLKGIRAERPDLILLDMHLPDMDGLELLQQLKADPATADIPVVAVSADALASQVSAALEGGARQYLTKPISVSEMLAVIDDLLDQVDTQHG